MDATEFSSRVRAIESKLYRCAVCIVKNDEDAADAVQEALLAAWKSIRSLRYPEFFETWLMRILINQSKSILKLRSRRSEQALSPELTTEEPDESPVRAALMALDEKYRLPLVLYHLHGYDVNALSKILHLPAGTVKTRLARGRKTLKSIMEREEMQ